MQLQYIRKPGYQHAGYQGLGYQQERKTVFILIF